MTELRTYNQQTSRTLKYNWDDKMNNHSIDDLPTFTIVIATYNAARTLQKCLDSVLSQSYSKKEIIIIDGASTDSTIELLRTNDAHLAYWESSPDQGIYDAWNKALPHSTGDWILFLGADDTLWSRDTLLSMASCLNSAFPAHFLAYGQIAAVDEGGRVIDVQGQPWEIAKRRFYNEMTLPHTAMFHHRKVFETYGAFDASFRIAGDYEFMLRVLRNSSPLFVGAEILVAMQQGGLSTAPRTSLLTYREFRRARKLHSYPELTFGWLWSYTKAIIKLALNNLLPEHLTRTIIDIYRLFTLRRPSWQATSADMPPKSPLNKRVTGMLSGKANQD